jgi:hypothetical protein
MGGILGVVVSVSRLSEARRLISLTDRVRTLAEKLFKEIEEISGRRLPKLGICLHEGFSGQLCAPLPHLPAWYSGNTIHFLADVDWWRKASENLLKEKHLSNVINISKTIKQYSELLDLEFLVYTLCGHEACHFLRLFGEDEKYYDVAPRWMEEGLCFFIPYKLIEKRKKRLGELAFKTDQIIFEALKAPLSKRDHWLYELYDFEVKYSKAGEELKGLIDLWDYSASVVAVHELFSLFRKPLSRFIDAISDSWKRIHEAHDKVKANMEFMETLFTKLKIRETTVDDFCLKFRICPTT